MRQRLLIAGLSAVLFLSGWGGVFASAMCRHAGLPAADAQESHACCRTEAAGAGLSSEATAASHCPLSESAAPETNAHAQASDGEHAPSPASSTAASSPAVASEAASSVEAARVLDTSPDACAHCFVRSETPPARFALPETHARKRADTADAALSDAVASVLLVRLRAPLRVSRGGEPPGASTPRHLLHSVFLI
ncbi:MAG TPA: hypothetical protein VF754_02250 [Pyrinomonadaceae bacterium]